VVDGTTFRQSATPFTDHSGEHQFPLAGHDARLLITTNGLTYSYDLLVDGHPVTGSDAATAPARPRVGWLSSQRTGGIVLLVLWIPMSAFIALGAYDEYRYHTSSATAVGVVQDMRTISGRYGPTYELTYVFVDQSGTAHTDRGDVPRATYEQARPGSRFVIRYLPDDPSRSRVLGQDDTLPLVALIAFAVAGLAYGGYAVIAGSRRAATLARVSQVGQTTTATVTKLKETTVFGAGKAVTVEYTYVDPFGRTRRGRGPLMYPSEGATYKVGGPVRVLVDPDRPGDSVLL
jgi:hypothetical protein